MPIKFLCEHCHNEVTAPDSAAGKRGKCPFCSNSMQIPAPISEDDILPLAPIDEEEERRLREEEEALWREDIALLDTSDDNTDASVVEGHSDMSSEELRRFAINYCLAMAGSDLDRASTLVVKLKRFGLLGHEAVDGLMNDDALDPALAGLPAPLVKGFLAQLRKEL